MGGSQGWSSAGIFNEARVQLHRFLAAGGVIAGIEQGAGSEYDGQPEAMAARMPQAERSHARIFNYLARTTKGMEGSAVARFEGRIGATSVASVAVSGSASRYFLWQILESSSANVFFLSHSEVPPGVKVISLGMIK